MTPGEPPTATPPQPPPWYVLRSAPTAAAVLRRLARRGWRVRDGFALPDRQWDVTERRLLLHGRISDPETLRLAVLAAARGAAVVAVTDPAGALGRELVADLGRLGPVHLDDRTGPAAATDATPAADRADPGTGLTPQQRALLRRLADGQTIAAAATAEFLSLRTANRHIARARELLGVRTTREAVLRYLRHADGHPDAG